MPRSFLPLALALGAGAVCASAVSAQPAAAPTAWPAVTQSAKPWTRWWWPGSAVDEASVTRQLTQFQQAGLGGVEITPIYGALGYESRYIDFLTPRWMEMLRHTGTEAGRLGLGVDMATGTGWPFGGPWVAPADGSQRLAINEGKLAGKPTAMKVKRAAPGDEGLVVDPYSVEALQRYLAPFSQAFAGFPTGVVRGQFHDSFEYYGAEWTPGLGATFRRLHGYDLDTHAADLMGQGAMPEEQLRRLKADYRATLAQLHLDYLREWVRWSHERGWIVRNQSHGAPANLLDLYGTVDVPETEIFGSTPFKIPGLRRNSREVRSDQDLPEPLVMRLASSAAHVMGRPFTSSESCTWLREHWKVALSFTKPELDRLFVNGINHIFYHGTVFSPTDATWPGWLFYASTQFNPNNTWWDDFGALNRYVARVQSVVQGGRPDHEVLLYWPFADVIDEPKGLMLQFGVHNVSWLTQSPFGQAAQQLARRGYGCDFVSDAQLLESKPGRDGGLDTPGNHYRVLLVPAARRMPVETLRQIVALARAKVAIHLLALPEDVPGLGNLEARRAEFHRLLAEIRELAQDKRYTLHLGAGADGGLNEALLASRAAREPMADAGLEFIRRATDTGRDYFLANLGADAIEGWFALGSPATKATLLDPLTDREGLAALRTVAGKPEVYLQLAAGQSLVLRTLAGAKGPAATQAWSYVATAGAPVPLAGEWQIEFLKGGPALPPPLATSALRSWTELGGEDAQNFSGTARYRIEFTAPAGPADDWLLDLGDVRESARVRLNGTAVATAWSVPFRVRLGALPPGRNVLELEVTNLAANRIRDLDRRGVKWRIMREINFVNIRYQPFDASGWEIEPSGLLGPVTLTPLRRLDPK